MRVKGTFIFRFTILNSSYIIARPREQISSKISNFIYSQRQKGHSIRKIAQELQLSVGAVSRHINLHRNLQQNNQTNVVDLEKRLEMMTSISS